jgi:tRNA-dihydrouridine synthase B
VSLSPPTTLKLGSLELSSPFILAPLESVSDCAFRRICWEQGAAFTFTEMVRARGIVRNNKATLDLIDTFDAETPTGLQLMVTNEAELQSALDTVEHLAATTHPHFKNIRIVDLNFGCPSPEIIKIGAGPAMLKRRAKLELIFAALKGWKQRTSLPIGAVGAKIRLGLHGGEQAAKVFLPVVDLANEHLDYLTVHARHAREESKDVPSWSAIRESKQRAKVPIIGNGNVFGHAEWVKLFNKAQCDGALIARGAIKSPWVFRELKRQGPGEPTFDELTAAESRYAALAKQYGSKEKFVKWHTEGFRRMRARLEGTGAQELEIPANEHLS